MRSISSAVRTVRFVMERGTYLMRAVPAWRRRASPFRRGLAHDHDALLLERDVAALHEVLEDAAHHLARAPHAAGDVRLAQALDHQSPAFIARRIEEQPRHAPVDVEQGQVSDRLRELPDAADELADEVRREVRVRGDQVAE